MDNVLQACKVLVCELAMLWMTQAHCESFSRLAEIYQSRWERINREIDAQPLFLLVTRFSSDGLAGCRLN
jgi:hypothetical protein